MELIIYCEECTTQGRLEHTYNKYLVHTFYSLTDAVQHINQYGHSVKIELEHRNEEE